MIDQFLQILTDNVSYIILFYIQLLIVFILLLPLIKEEMIYIYDTKRNKIKQSSKTDKIFDMKIRITPDEINDNIRILPYENREKKDCINHKKQRCSSE